MKNARKVALGSLLLIALVVAGGFIRRGLDAPVSKFPVGHVWLELPGVATEGDPFVVDVWVAAGPESLRLAHAGWSLPRALLVESVDTPYRTRVNLGGSTGDESGRLAVTSLMRKRPEDAPSFLGADVKIASITLEWLPDWTGSATLSPEFFEVSKTLSGDLQVEGEPEAFVVLEDGTQVVGESHPLEIAPVSRPDE